MFSQRLKEKRQKACCSAEQELLGKGFTVDDGEWHGSLDCGECGILPVRLQLPTEFSEKVPEVFVDRSKLKRRVPHIEKNGKLCVVPTTGTLLNAEDPQGIVLEVLGRARHLLIDGLSGQVDEHFYDEFLAYWNPNAGENIFSICRPAGPARELCLVRIEKDCGKVPRGQDFLVAESLEEAQEWLRRLDGAGKKHHSCFFLPLSTPFMPPDFEEVLSVNDVLHKIRRHSEPEVFAAFQSWANKAGNAKLPLLVILSLPLRNQQGYVLVGVIFEEAKGHLKKRAYQGWRPEKVTAWREMNFSLKQAVTLVSLKRLDASFLLPRGGTLVELFSRSIVIAGCGAVGSHVAERLASLGIGRLKFLDGECLTNENIHRHALGVQHIGINKAKGMSEVLRNRFPHITFEYREQKIESLLESEPGFVTDADLLVIAIGEETLELRLNDILRDSLPRLHTWLDPLGIGGHVLATGVSEGRGCFQCLFQLDADHGLTNTASFAQAGQSFQKSFAGCAGTFTPFAGIHADRTAIETATLAAQILGKQETKNILVSWFGDPNAFEQAGFRLSSRADLFKVGECRREARYAREECPACGSSYMKFARPKGGVVEFKEGCREAFINYRQLDTGDKEAGGILLGRLIIGTQDVVIDEITTPTSGDKAGRFFFFRNRSYAQKHVNKAWKGSSHTRIYLGEWHTHPEKYPSPSEKDRQNWIRISKKSKYEQDFLLFVVVGQEAIRIWEIARSRCETIVSLAPLC